MKTIYSSAFLCFFLVGFSSWAQLDQTTAPGAGGAETIPWSPAEAVVLEAASNAVQAATIIWLPDQPVEGAVGIPTQDASSNGQNTVRFVYQTSPAVVAATMTAALGAARSGNSPQPLDSLGACVRAGSGLVAWWQAEGNANDSAGSHAGQTPNGCSFVPGQVGQAFSFNGVNQSVQIPYSNELATACFTVEAWVKPAQAIGGQTYIFGQAYGRSLVVQPGSGGLHVAFMITDTNGAFYAVSPTGLIPISQWTHLAGTWDGANLKLYTNGVQAHSAALQLPAIGNSGCPFSIGGFNSSCGYYGQYFPGLIDEVSQYDRALFPGEINAIYLAGSAGKCKTATGCATSPLSAVASWPGEGDASDMLNNYPGTVPNGVSFDCGIVGRAFSFNGTNQSVQIPDASALATAAFSVEVWVNPSGQVGGGQSQAYIFGQAYGRNLVARAGNHGLGVAFQISSNSWSFHEVDSSGEIPIGEWTHLVGTWDGASLSLYINGALDQQAGVNIAVWDSGCPFSIGGFNNSCGYSGQYFLGLIDETTYYNEALSAADVQALYNGGSAGKCYSLGYWLQYYFGTNCWNEPYATAPADADGDGHTNFEEYLAHTDPNKIRFSISVTNEYVTTTAVPLQVSILGGVPSYIAWMTNDTNTAHANWQPYAGTNLNVTLGPTDGTYVLWVGLKGLPADAQQTWDGLQITLDRAGPVLAITNPILTGAAAAVAKPYLQLAGWANESLAAISYDLVNAAGTSTNLDGFVTDQFFDTNRFNYTTTYFQCFDIPLTNGANAIALHATDLAGNVSTTNITVTLDYSTATSPPVVSLAWPPVGIPLSGPIFYVRGRVSDETAAVTAQVVDAGGNTNVADGIVERNGVFWVEDLPLADGASTVTVTVTDAAGHVTRTNLTVMASNVTLTIDSTPSGADLYQATGNVSGNISDPSYAVVVNGIPATVYESGYWQADNVPIRGQGTATFDAVASGASSAADSAAVEMPAYIGVVDYHDTKYDNRYYPGPPSSSSTYMRGKHFTATYQADPTGTWTSAYHGVVADYSAGSPPLSWVAQDYDWSNAGSITHQTDSYGDDATWDGINENYGAVTGLPDQDLLEAAPGGPVPKWVYHYYASGVRYEWPQHDGSLAEVGVDARMRLKLFTGGKARLNRNSLIHIRAGAVQYGTPPIAAWIGTPEQDVDPTNIYVLGQRLVHRSSAPIGDLYINQPDNAAPDLNLRIPGTNHYNAKVYSVDKVRLNVTQVTFDGSLPILQDTTNVPYSSPHYQTNEVDHTVISYPVLYVSGSNVQTTTRFSNHAPSGSGDYPLIIKGVVSGGGTSFNLWGTNTSTVGGYCEVPTCADHPLTPSKVDYYKPMTIHWYYGFTNKPDYLDAGITTNHVYVSLTTPATANLYHTVVDLACYDPGATTPMEAAMNTWSFFPGPGNVTTWDGRELHYYQSGIPMANEVMDVSGLLLTANAQCDAWRDLLESAWAVNGVPCVRAEARPVVANGFLAKNWQFGTPTLEGSYDYYLQLNRQDVNGLVVASMVPSVSGDLVNSSGAAGQNSPTPAEKVFPVHYFEKLLLDNKYYDPSYGLTYTDDADFEAKAVNGYFMVIRLAPPDPDGPPPAVAVQPVGIATGIHITP